MSGKFKYNIEIIKNIFESEGYKLLSSKYESVSTPLETLCPVGHKYSVSINCFKNLGSRCPECLGKKKYTIEECKEIFEKEGYTLLSSEYEGNKQKLTVKCPNGHGWRTSIKGFRAHGYRCSKCKGKRKYTLEEAREIFRIRGYLLISKYYNNIYQSLYSICPNGHLYVVSLGSFNNKGNGCKFCLGTYTNDRESIEHTLNEEGYSLISKEFGNIKSRIILRCPMGHEYTTTFNMYKNSGIRCSICKINIKENEVRKIIENITLRPFPNIYPEWLINPETGRKLELDGFNEELKLAFEYDGPYHYIPIHNKEILKSQQNRDFIKNEICKANGVTLIRIPYFLKNKEEYIRNEIAKLNWRDNNDSR